MSKRGVYANSNASMIAETEITATLPSGLTVSSAHESRNAGDACSGDLVGVYK